MQVKPVVRTVKTAADLDAPVHLATVSKSRGVRTGRLVYRSYRPACGARLGSAYGSTTSLQDPSTVTCRRCRRRMNRS